MQSFINFNCDLFLWQLKLGFVGTNQNDFSSLNSASKKPFKPILSSLIKSNYGDCSLTVECETVALEARVRLPPFALVIRVDNSRSITW